MQAQVEDDVTVTATSTESENPSGEAGKKAPIQKEFTEQDFARMEATADFMQSMSRFHMINGFDKRKTLITWCRVMRAMGIPYDLKEMFMDGIQEDADIEKEVDEAMEMLKKHGRA